MAKTRPKPPANPALGRAISAAQDRGYTQKKIAADVSLYGSQVGRFVTGEREPYVMDLVRLSRVLGVNPFSLIFPYLSSDDMRRLEDRSNISDRAMSVMNNSLYEEFHKLYEIFLALNNIPIETPSLLDNVDDGAKPDADHPSFQK